MMPMPKVSIVKTKDLSVPYDLSEALESLVAPWGGISAFVRLGDRVLLKPNVGTCVPADSPLITSAILTEAVARLVLAAGATEVWVAESCVVGTCTTEAYAASGYADLPDRVDVSLIDLKKGGHRSVTVANPLQLKQIAVFEKAFEADVIINLPKLKTIIATPISVGMKNLKGLIPDFEKRRCHHTDLNRAIVDICQTVKPSLTIVDGIVGCGLYEAIPHNILIAGDNIVAVDAVAAICMGIEPKQVKYLALGAEIGLGPLSLDKITLEGESPFDVKLDYPVAKGDLDGYAKLYPHIQIAAGQACSGCVNMIELLLKNAIKLGVYKKWQDKLVLAIGPKAPLDHPGKTVLCLGNCLEARHCENFVPGCTFISVDAAHWMVEHDPV